MSLFLLTQPLKVLIAIAESLMEEDFDYESPWDESDENLSLLKGKTNWLGGKVDEDDMEFMAAFMLNNRRLLEDLISGKVSKSEAISEFEMPRLQKYKVWYEVWGNATLTEKYKTKWESYNRNWVKDSLRHAYNEGSFDYYQGEYVEYETDNFDADNFEILDIRPIDENTKPILSKLVVENTKEMIESLDKDTLIELRNLINRKLSS